MAFSRRTFLGISELLDSINTKIQNALLPSGAIVWFKRQTAPEGWAICDGTNGTPNLIGRYALGATSGIGTLVDAGLPNITGSIRANTSNTGVASGFAKVSGTYNTFMEGGHSDDWGRIYEFDASWSSSIYGKSTTVTPPSTKLLPCMKL